MPGPGFVPVFSVVFHVELVEDDLRQPRNIVVHVVKARPVGEDAVCPWSVGLWESWGLGCHVFCNKQMNTFCALSHNTTAPSVSRHFT